MKIRARTARGVGAALLGCAAMLAPAVAVEASASPARSASAGVNPACQTPGLVIWFDPNGSGTLGSTFYHLRFTNLSGHACTLNGFPFMFAISLSGRQIGLRARFTGPVHAVTLARRGTVHAVLQVTDVFNFPKSLCEPVFAAGFKVFPPNQQRAKTVPFPFRACSLNKRVFLRISGLSRGF